MWAIYTQKCTDGEFKSLAVIIGSSILIALIGLICCIRNRKIEKKLRLLQTLERKETKR